MVMDTAVHQEEKQVIGGWRKRLKVQCIMPAAAQIAWLVCLLMSFLIRGLYSPDFGNITELIKMIGMEKVGCQ